MDINAFKILDKDGLLQALKLNGHNDVINVLKYKNINGKLFLQLTERELDHWHLNFVQKKSIISCINQINENPSKYVTRSTGGVLKNDKHLNISSGFKGKLEGILGGNNTGTPWIQPRSSKVSDPNLIPVIKSVTIPGVNKPAIPKKDMSKMQPRRPSIPLLPPAEALPPPPISRQALPLPPLPNDTPYPVNRPSLPLPQRPSLPLPPDESTQPLNPRPSLPLPSSNDPPHPRPSFFPLPSSIETSHPVTNHHFIPIPPVEPSPPKKRPSVPLPLSQDGGGIPPPSLPRSFVPLPIHNRIPSPSNTRPSLPLPPPDTVRRASSPLSPPLLSPLHSEYMVMTSPKISPKISPLPIKKTIWKPPTEEDENYLMPNDLMENEYEAEPQHHNIAYKQLKVTLTDNSLKSVILPKSLPRVPEPKYLENTDEDNSHQIKDNKISPVAARRNSFLKIRDSFKKFIGYENVAIVETPGTGQSVRVNLIVNRPLPSIPATKEPPIFNPNENNRWDVNQTHQRPLPSLPKEKEAEEYTPEKYTPKEIEDDYSNFNGEEPIYENLKHILETPEVPKDNKKEIPAHLSGLIENLARALEKQRMSKDNLLQPLMNLHDTPDIIDNEIILEQPEEDQEIYENLPLPETENELLYGNVDALTTANSCTKCKTGSCSCNLKPSNPTPRKSCSCTKPHCECDKKTEAPQNQNNANKSCSCSKSNCGCSKKQTTRSISASNIQTNSTAENTVNLNNEPFYRNTDRKGARLLLQHLEDGAFLLRPGKIHFLVLTVKYGKKYYNLGISKTTDNMLKCDCTGEEPLEFATVEQLTKYFEFEPLRLQDTNDVVNVKLKPVLK